MKKLMVSESELAAHWGITTRRVRQLREESVAVHCAQRYDLAESDKRLIAWLRRDEETRRVKRRLLQHTILASERRIQRSERELLTIEEVREVLNTAWNRMWMTHATIATHFRNVCYGLPDKDSLAHELEQNCKGELRLLSECFQALTKEAAEKLDCRLRNGIFQTTREIACLHAEYGTQDDA